MRKWSSTLSGRVPPWLAGLFLVLILIPTLFLGYFSVRAIEAERLSFRQRIIEGYTHLAEFAQLAISRSVKDLGERWLLEIRPQEFVHLEHKKQAARLDSLVSSHPLVSGAYLLRSNGQVLYPLNRNAPTTATSSVGTPTTPPDFERWLNRFRQLCDRAETLEFEKKQSDSALHLYQHIVRTNPIPRLQAIALREIARIYMFKADWPAAYRTYRQIIERYPNARDLNNLHLRFDARFQSVVALENMQQTDRAVEELLRLYTDLLQHSDEINDDQFKFFLEVIQKKFQGLIGGVSPEKQPEMRARFHHLQEQKKKSISSRYFVQKLHQRLIRAILRKRTYRDRFKYLSDVEVDHPYLMAYLLLAPNRKTVVDRILGLEINIDSLKAYLFPRILRKKRFPEDVIIAILDEKGNYVMGDVSRIVSEPVVLVPLKDPLDFWRLGIFPTFDNPLLQKQSYGLYVKLVGTLLLVMLIVLSSAFLLYYIRKQQLASLQKTTFVSSITHELRTPLTSIRMFSELLMKEKTHLPEREIKYLKIIHGEALRLERMISNVLDYSKIERGVKKYQFDYQDARALIDSVVDSLKYQAETQGVKLRVDAPDDLPEIYADRDSLRQALINLVTNAIKYSLNKTPVDVRARVNGRFLEIQVIDRGIGIEARHLNKIFQEFYRVEEGEAANIGGSGLGLALTRRIVEAHGGHIQVVSEPGRGTTFTVQLPLAEGETPNA